MDYDFNSLETILKNKIIKKDTYKFQWQELAMTVIEELGIPSFKKSSVFKVCKENNRQVVMNAFNDTKELCNSKESWKYFFKLINKFK